jgi:hypothetical protein
LDPTILLIIVFIVAPLVERLLKSAKTDAERKTQQRPPRVEPRPQDEAPPRVVVRRQTQDDSAADMLPQDLWEILTGEKRSPVPQPTPAPQPAPDWDVDNTSYEDDVESYDEAQSLETASDEWVSPPPEPAPAPTPEPARYPARAQRNAPEPRKREVWRNPELHDATFERPIPVRDAPVVVSLEELDIDGRKRHDSFHDRLERMPAGVRGRTQAASGYRFKSPEELRHAIVTSEILGRPRGLD